EQLVGRALNGHIDRGGGGRRLEVELGRECTAVSCLVNKASRRIDNSGSADGQEDVAVARRGSRIELPARQRFPEPDDPRARQPAARATYRRQRLQWN